MISVATFVTLVLLVLSPYSFDVRRVCSGVSSFHMLVFCVFSLFHFVSLAGSFVNFIDLFKEAVLGFVAFSSFSAPHKAGDVKEQQHVCAHPE